MVKIHGDPVHHCDWNAMVEGINQNGVLSGLAVSQHAAGADMSVDVAVGSALVDEEKYIESSVTNLAIDASESEKHRKDTIIYDTATSAPAVIKGTAVVITSAAAPPSVTADDILLAVVYIGDAVTSITDSDIYDGRITIAAIKDKWDATVAPTANEDTDDGYEVGSRWIDITHDKKYVCVDSSAAAAVWLCTVSLPNTIANVLTNHDKALHDAMNIDADTLDGHDSGYFSSAIIFGDGGDGDVTISGNTSLTRDMYYNTLIVNAGIILNANGYRIFVKDTLTNNGTIRYNGNNGGTASVGAALVDHCLGGSAIGGTSGTTGATSGGNGGSVASGLGGNGGGGGDVSSGGTVTTPNVYGGGYRNVDSAIRPIDIHQGANPIAVQGGAGGGGGKYVSAAPGGGGSGGGVLVICAGSINNGSGTIEALGGNGGNGGNPGSGGGGGGGGGCVILITHSLTAGTISVTGGTGGTGEWNGSNGSVGTTIQIGV